MIRIAFCDDDPTVLSDLHELLTLYRAKKEEEITDDIFHSPLDLIAEIERGVRYDILFLDVLMPGESGIDAATEIRSYDKNTKIIFLTSSQEYAVQSYAVNAFYYQMKPICAESFSRLMDSVLALCEKEKERSLILHCKTGITQIKPTELEYCEVIHRTLFIHMTSGKVLESIGSLDELSKQLMTFGNFIRPHRSYLVNLDYIQNLSYRAITMSCLTEIPIPRGKYNEIKNAFLEYAFLSGR
ncbi:MAG: LytTR family DNA-binding domain-containing protein [bacterium]|nr:LytTR family DNA-binding domain-containing protein [bacterium]